MDNFPLKHRDLTQKIIAIFYEVYNELGHGFIESVYENSISIALRQAGHEALQQIDVPVWFRGTRVGNFEADILVDRRVILELKSARAIDPAHTAQLLNYLRATEIEVGLVLNFGPKPDFKRLAFDNDRKRQTNAKTGILNALLDE